MNFSREWLRIEAEQKKIIEQYLNEYPIKVGAIAKALNIKVKSSTLEAGISGEIRETEGVCTIRVNRHDVKTRQRFTLAHEIAHFLLHKEMLSNGIKDNIMYRSSLSDSLEAEANRLAADIIMPWEVVEKMLRKYSGSDLDEKIEFIAKELQVSTTALKIRLGKI